MSGVRSVKPLVSSSREIHKHWQVISPPHTLIIQKKRPQWNQTLVLITLNWAMYHKQAQTESAAFFFFWPIFAGFESAEWILTCSKSLLVAKRIIEPAKICCGPKVWDYGEHVEFKSGNEQICGVSGKFKTKKLYDIKWVRNSALFISH